MKNYVTPELLVVLMDGEAVCSTSNGFMGTDGGGEYDYFIMD